MSEGGLSPTRFAEDLALASERFDVVRADGSVLLLDLDTPASSAQFDRVLPKVRELFAVSDIQEWKSKSGNRHVLVRLDRPQPVAVRIGLQAALGSDGVREVLAFMRLENGVVEPSALFRPKVPEW